MSRIKSGDTAPELAVRQALHARGFRFRLRAIDLPGKPDVVLPKFKTVIFVHGCFWHQHLNCRRASKPKTRRDYWEPKLRRNTERDASLLKEIKALGWRPIVIWECQALNPHQLSNRLSSLGFLKRG
jgi:DNA mismatch endonuclease (patch repair protein)